MQLWSELYMEFDNNDAGHHYCAGHTWREEMVKVNLQREAQ